MTAQPDIFQLALPDPDALPAWVKQAMSEYRTDQTVYLGYDTLLKFCDELDKSQSSLEKWTLIKLRKAAMLWQKSNYRTYITSHEQLLLTLEREAMQHRHATRVKLVATPVLNTYGEWVTVEEYQDRIDMGFVLSYIQRRLSSMRITMGVQHIKHSLESISSVFYICALLDIEMEVKQSHYHAQTQQRRKSA